MSIKPDEVRVIAPTSRPEDLTYDRQLRPTTLDEFVGQPKLKEQLRIFIDAARNGSRILDHTLFYGYPGLGKTTLAHIISNEMQSVLRTTSGPVLERPGDMASILTSVDIGTTLFIDECHRLPNAVEEILYPAMEDYKIDLMLGEGPSARSIRMDLNPFTLCAATTRMGLLTSPLRDRFEIVLRLDFYEPEDLAEIVHRSAKKLSVEITAGGALEIANRSRFTPRVANRVLRRVRDYAQEKADGTITAEVADHALTMLGIDTKGLDDLDTLFMRTLIDKYGGGPVGIDTLAASIGEDRGTLEDVVEPFLLQLGFLMRTNRGRVATPQAGKHFNWTRSSDSGLNFDD